MPRKLACLALALAALAGCGGDELSPDEYRAELRRICADADRLTNRVEQPTRATPQAIADYLRRLRDTNARTIQRVEELEPPEELRAAHDRALAANREGRRRVDDVIRRLEAGEDPTQVLADARRDLSASSEAAKRAGRDLGVPECGD
jgi:hypothetical protein